MKLTSANNKRHFVNILSIVLLSSCGITSQHHVRTGEDPRYQDKDVAFRTTYYFRVFDYCYSKHLEEKRTYPKTSGLYRFKMTGKSNTTFNAVKFESGILKSWELDPLGATVAYDKNIGRHRYVSAEETQNQATAAQAWLEYNQLKAELLALEKENTKTTYHNKALTASLTAVISNNGVSSNLVTDLNQAFSNYQNNTLNSINTDVQRHVVNALKNKQNELLKSNHNKLAQQFNDKSKEWLLETIIEELKSGIDRELLTLPNDAISNDKSKWQTFTTRLNNVIDFPVKDNKKAHFIAKLSEKYKSIKDVSELESLQINKNGSLYRAIDLLAKHYIEELNNKNISINSLKDKFDNVYTIQKTSLKQDDGTFKSLTTEDKAMLRKQLFSQVHKIFSFATDLENNLKNVPKSFDFSAQISPLNIFTELNKSNLNQALLNQSNLLINSAVQQAYYDNTSKFGTTLDTLQKAMNAKLAIATGTSTTSAQVALNDSDNAINCSQVNKRTGFQILGPEGWRTFDQDERLVMAMYSDNSPITGVLKELSKQVLDAHQANKPNLLPLVQAELRLTQAQQALINNKSSVTTTSSDKKGQALCQLIKQVNSKFATHDTAAATNNDDC
ncbi:hypothetical protein [Pseudoalteromonas piscicida]|uniref:hypothetical protein n=1 Tax=Pseudoalteromonas piscicida TaxID=43662 RepID=UPI003096BC99